ncbi:MAG TPA: sulfatase-like hydrolase/transferase, partial [Vicinamibacteria bacterium]|nr:sulfatase-like hydrolase/transferase [Vicinamibacteria bacterium]
MKGFAVAALAMAFAGCRSEPSGPFNFLLITLDTLRADRLGSYGYALGATPNLDRIAREGVRFEEAVSPVPLTLPSHATILTGLFPMGHGVRDNGTYLLADEETTLAEILKAQGYETAAFVSSFVVDSRFGLSQGFDTYYDFDEEASAAEEAKRGLANVQRPGGDTAKRAVEWLSRPRQAPFFLWLHLYDPHSPFEAPEPYRSRFPERPYDAEVAYTDAVVGDVLDAVGDETLVVVVGDHGESLGEHGEEYHSWFVYDATLLVPWLMRLPRVVPEGITIEEQVRLADLAPTALDLLGLSVPDSMQGKSVAPWLRGEGPERLAAYSESLVAHLQFGWGELTAIRDRGYKYIQAPRPELYDVERDPGESRNLLSEKPEIAAELASRLAQLEEAFRRGQSDEDRSVVDAETLRKLQSLGYVGAAGSTPTTPESLAVDPKDRIEDYREFSATIEAALDALDASDPESAIRLLSPLAAKLPMHHLVHYHLGQAHAARREYDRAVEELDLAVELAPKFAEARTDLAEALVRSGRAEQAVAILEEGLESQPEHPGLHFQLGFARHALGQLDRALDSYRKASELGPAQSQLLSNMAALYLQRSEPSLAVERLSELVAADVANALAWNNLGLALVQAGRLLDAGPAFERATALEP